jgi:hypothetical protein
MLDYFEIDLNGKKDEKMNDKQKTDFLEKFNQIYDFYILQDIIEKIKNERTDQNSDMFGDDTDDDMDEFLPKHSKPTDKNKKDFYKSPDEFDNTNDFNSDDNFTTDANKFLKWLTMILLSGNHTIFLSEDKDGIYIKLVKINKGKK